MSLADYKAYDKVIDKLSSAIQRGRLSHAYIFEGDSVSGKENIARDFAKAILCTEKPGIGCDKCKHCKMIDADTYRDIYYFGSDGSSIKDRDIEELQSRMGSLPIEDGGRNIAIVEDSDLMTTRAQNRLLKLLEEPHPGSVVILLSENSDRMLATVRSRCQRFRFYDLESPRRDGGDEEYVALAKEVIGRLGRNEFFAEIRNNIAGVTDKKNALLFLDAMEREMRNILIGQSALKFPRERGAECIRYIEDARKKINYNVKAKTVLSQLVLKIGG